MRITSISKTDTLYFKAIGILMIVFHNFFHWTRPWGGENEFQFVKENVENFYKNLINTPFEAINVLFSFLGHYGVQIFIFISAIGLTYSLLRKPVRYGSYVMRRFKALYSMLIVAVVFYFFSRIILDQYLLTTGDWQKWLWNFLFIHTIKAGQTLTLNGPYWFFGLIAQLYLLFPLLLYVVKKYNFKGFVLICLFSYICSYFVLFVVPLPEGVFWNANSIAHLPEFALGIWIALNPKKHISPIVFIVALAFLVLGNIFEVFFPLTFLSAAILLFAMIMKSREFFNRKVQISKIMQRIGTLSMAIFIVHGVFRTRFLKMFSTSWYELLIGALLWFITIYAVAIIAEKVYQWIYGKINMIGK